MSDFVSFGTPEHFEIAARWVLEDEPRDRLPAMFGWSAGDLRITVGRQVLTQRLFNNKESDYVSWYLGPVADWLITNWVRLFHEEAFAWTDTSGAPAAPSVLSAIGWLIASTDPEQHNEYASVHSWWSRHALRAADPSALYPDICFRRLGDDVEISWAERQPSHAPDGYVLRLTPGYATVPVAAVVEPIWKFLIWLVDTAPAPTDGDRQCVAELRHRLSLLGKTPLRAFEVAHLGSRVQEVLQQARKVVPLRRDGERLPNVPAIESFDSAVLMFGGLNPEIGVDDSVTLLQFLAESRGGTESDELRKVVRDLPPGSALQPHFEGYELAEEVRDLLEIDAAASFVDVRGLLTRLSIRVKETALRTETVRGVAVAGPGHAPSILVNTASMFNRSEEGRRFTLAHEFCHILHDRTHAKKLSHASGPWTSPRVEKRANAFAAMFLASRASVRRRLAGHDVEAIETLARDVKVGFVALVEHLHNLGLIDEVDREKLRAHANRQPVRLPVLARRPR